VIAGLALGVLVVEAAERSGSLITARLANELGRDVYAVPGNVTSANSFGPNYLIKDGAKLVQDWADIVDELPAAWRDPILEAERDRMGSIQATLGAGADISANEGKVLKHLSLDTPRHADAVAAASRLEPGPLSDALFTLEEKGLVAALPGGFYLKRL
jgi:DNA processing protein